jgi:hypothetical protein
MLKGRLGKFQEIDFTFSFIYSNRYEGEAPPHTRGLTLHNVTLLDAYPGSPAYAGIFPVTTIVYVCYAWFPRA